MLRVLALSALLLAQAAPPQGPTIYWKLDEAAGTVADDAFGANDGVHAGGTPSLDRPTLNFNNPQSRSYDGVDDGTSRAASGIAAGNTSHSIAMWIKVTAMPPVRAWIALLGNEGAGNHHWLLSSNGSTQFGVWGGSPGNGQIQPTLDDDGVWRHLATTFNGTTLRCYLNGVEVGTGVPATFALAGVPFTVATIHNGENGFNGVIDDVRVYARALSAAEVQYLAAGNGPPAAPASLTATPDIQEIDLSWPAVANAHNYTLHRTTSLNDPNPPVIATLNGTTYTDPGLDPATTYYYVVRANHSVGDPSAFSPVASANALPIPPRTEDHEEGFFDDRCACGATIASPLPFAVLGLALLLGLLRFRA